MGKLQWVNISDYKTKSGKTVALQLSYQLFGKKLGEAPVVLVNHALTGNSHVCGEQGWWQDLIGDEKPINTQQFTVLAFNIPGNVYDGFVIDNYQDFSVKDIAQLFLKGVEALQIHQLFAIIGGSLGGAIAWQMAYIQPNITQHLIPIAADYKSTDWLIANCRIQEQLLNNSSQPIHDARMHAMLLYRTPQSFQQRFNRSINEELHMFNIESWLLHHGKKLQQRFQLSAYKMMNHLLKNIDVLEGNPEISLAKIKSNIHLIAVDSDLFFLPDENKNTYATLLKEKSNIHYHEITSIHGHDAFLIEYEQLKNIILPIFNDVKETIS